MAIVGRDKKEKKLRENVETSLEREVRQIKETQQRELKPGEREQLRQKWEEGAARIDRSGKLAEVWNPKYSDQERPKSRPLGYFTGVNFDKNGKIVQ